MDKRNIMIGGAVLAIGGAIAAGAFLGNARQSSSEKLVDAGVAEQLEEQNFRDFANEDKYSFCQGREEIRGVYTNSVFGTEVGNIEYISEDISVFDKEKNKLFILGRKIQYKYSGNAKVEAGGGQGSLDIEESGETVEYYSKYSAPVRIDYNSKIINPAPERKSSDWVVVNIKSVGTLMGITDRREDVETGDAKILCPSFNLTGAFVSPDYFSFERACPNVAPELGSSFTGNFKFECGSIDNEKGIEVAKGYKQTEQLRNEFDAIVDGETGESPNEFQGIIKEPSSDSRDMQKKLEEMRKEMVESGEGIR